LRRALLLQAGRIRRFPSLLGPPAVPQALVPVWGLPSSGLNRRSRSSRQVAKRPKREIHTQCHRLLTHRQQPVCTSMQWQYPPACLPENHEQVRRLTWPKPWTCRCWVCAPQGVAPGSAGRMGRWARGQRLALSSFSFATAKHLGGLWPRATDVGDRGSFVRLVRRHGAPHLTGRRARLISMGLAEDLDRISRSSHRRLEQKHMKTAEERAATDAEMQWAIVQELRRLNEQVAWQNQALSQALNEWAARRP